MSMLHPKLIQGHEFFSPIDFVGIPNEINHIEQLESFLRHGTGFLFTEELASGKSSDTVSVLTDNDTKVVCLFFMCVQYDTYCLRCLLTQRANWGLGGYVWGTALCPFSR